MKILKKTLDEYVMSGMEVPIGLLEQYKKDHNKDYEPSAPIKLMYKIITNKDYEHKNN